MAEEALKDEILPFGKYKGQPVEVLQGDPQYAEWLTQQGWLEEKHPKIHNLIINNYAAPTETPEHNAMQAKFFDPDFADEAARTFYSCYSDLQDLSDKAECDQVKAEHHGFDLLLTALHSCTDGATGDIYQEERKFLVELKPSMGDDYPAVLRQINAGLERIAQKLYGHARGTSSDALVRIVRRNIAPILVVGSYSGRGATWDQLVNIFSNSGIACVKMDAIGEHPFG